MNINVDKFERSRWYVLRLMLSFKLEDVRDWFLRYIYAQHNARVIIDFEDRMSSTVYEATGGRMSKPYYTIEAIKSQIEDHQESERNYWYAEGRKDVCEELEVDDPNPPLESA